MTRDTEAERLLHYKPGSIRRVKLVNFLTYAQVEFRPGSRLNVVCGPNGTGKSTILCAICLGLGGQPPLLGRADDARTFIMHNQQVAEIEIELAPHDPSSPHHTLHIIKRVIDRNKGSANGRGKAASTYYINDEVVNVKAVQKLVQETYRIAIDNLCTFLPQDRVGSFSGFDSKMLLQETEKCVSGSKHLFTVHEQLMDLETQILSSGSNLQTMQDNVQRLSTETERLHKEKELMQERQSCLDEQTLIQQKRAWVQFDSSRELALTLKGQRKILGEKVKAVHTSLAPLEDELGQVQHQVNANREKSSTYERAITSTHRQYEAGEAKAIKYIDGIDAIQVDLNLLDSSKRRAEENVIKCRQHLEGAEAMLSDWPPIEELVQKEEKSLVDVRAGRMETSKRKRELSRLVNEQKDRQGVFKQIASKFEHMQDEKARRKDHIFGRDRNLGDVYAWVEQNRKEFRRPVSGPVICEISPQSSKYASYIEHHLPFHLLKTFIVECQEDYNLLYYEVREKRGLPINILRLDGGSSERLEPIRNRIYSEEKMNILKRDHGVVGYLDELFDAPDIIIKALRTANIQSVLVGDQRTFENTERKGLLDYLEQNENGPGIKPFAIYMNNGNKDFKQTSTISRYSGKSSLRMDEIPPARTLTRGVSETEKENVKKQLERAEFELQDLIPKVEEADARYKEAMNEAQHQNLILKDAQKAKNELSNLNRRVENARNKLRNAEEEASRDNDKERSKLMSTLQTYVDNYISALESASKSWDKFVENNCILAGIKMTEDGLVAKARKLNESLNDMKLETHNLEQSFKMITQQFREAKEKMRRMNDHASRIAPIKDSEGNYLPLKEKLDELPSDLSDLDEKLDEIEEKIKSIVDNPQVLRFYEETKKELEAAKLELENLEQSKESRRKELKELRQSWEVPLEKIVTQVNGLFEGYMKELGCAGEVRLSKGASGDRNGEESMGNFKDWGIEIRVKFREKSDLQVLSAQVHSGGERSVSTIMYLMAMQDLMVSPFRCVDEINQGLDERNERLVFRRIVHNSTGPPENENDLTSHCGQYFLITPKLLPNLTDMENDDVTVLCIYNGPFNFKHFTDWNVDKFLESRKRYASELNEIEDGASKKSRS